MSRRESCRLRHYALMLCFTVGMLLFEVCMEALFSLPGAPTTLSLWNTTVQFAFCALLPTISVLLQGRWRGARSTADVEDGHFKAAPKLSGESDGVGLLQLLHSWGPYLAQSALQFAAATAANHSLLFVDFTMKVVFKASKLLPTMAAATVLGNSRPYTTREYGAAVLVCAGTALFSCGGGKADVAVDGSPAANMAAGVSLLTFAVMAEGVLPNVQQAMLRRGASPDELMIRINVVGAVGGCLGLFLSGDWQRMGEYAAVTPALVPLLVAGGLAFSASVMSYTRLIEEAGSVFAVGVSTLRKSATVGLSFLLFPGKTFNSVRIAGLAAVLVGLLLAELASKGAPSRPAGRKVCDMDSLRGG